MRFKNAVHAHDGTEEEKVAAAKLHHPRPPSMPHPSCFTCKAKRRPTRTLRLCTGCNKTWFCHRQCQIDGWKKHKVAWYQASFLSSDNPDRQSYRGFFNLILIVCFVSNMRAIDDSVFKHGFIVTTFILEITRNPQ